MHDQFELKRISTINAGEEKTFNADSVKIKASQEDALSHDFIAEINVDFFVVTATSSWRRQPWWGPRAARAIYDTKRCDHQQSKTPPTRQLEKKSLIFIQIDVVFKSANQGSEQILSRHSVSVVSRLPESLFRHSFSVDTQYR